MPFALDSNPDISEVSDAINYLLANFGPGLSADAGTGQITGPTGEIAGYLYKYMAIKYADSFDGSLNFSDIPASHLYYGIRNNNDPAESSSPADYIWSRVSGGFGGTKSLWYICTGGRQIQFAASVSAPDTGWLVDPGSSIDLDVVTSGNIPVIAEAFFPYFTPAILQVPRTGGVTPVFTNITPVMFATDKGAVVSFTDAQTDTNAAFVNNSWRIGNSSTTGYADISLTNLTIGNPTDAGDYAQWPAPTAMSSSPAYITVPVRYKSSLGVVTQAGTATVQLVFVDPGATGSAGPTIDISGYTGFVQNVGGAYTPASATLTAITTNVTAPTYSWVISGATPTSASTASVVVTPTSSATNVTVTLTVNGSNLSFGISKTMVMPITYNGAAGQAGSNGVMSAFPTIFQWTGSSTPPTRPSTTSTYTWASGAYSAPSGWSTQAPSNTTAGNYLWSITVPLNASATTTTSTLDWTNTAYPIRAVAFNGYNGANGSDGSNGSNGFNGSATFLVTRTANDSSAPTDAETIAAIGRTPVAGDIVTVSYNSSNNGIVYRYVTSWILQTTYITGSLIVQNTITADKMVTGIMSADNTLTRGLTVRDTSGNILLASGSPLNYTNITASTGWLNSNITVSGGAISGIGTGSGAFVDNSIINITGGVLNGIGTGTGTQVANSYISLASNGVLSGAGGGAVTISGLGYSGDLAATKNVFSQGAYSAIPAGSNGDVYYATDTNQLYQKISGAWILSANNTYIDATGVIYGTSTGGGTTVANSQITITGGNITGIGTGSGTAVANSAISINSNGTLTGAGSGAVTPAGINAVNVNLSNAPAGILNSSVTLGTLGAGGFAYLSQITSANATTYIAGAAIGTAQVGVLTAGNIGANTIDASKIAANTITAGQIAANTITGTNIAGTTITASNIAANTITATQIAANTITATQIAASTITATQIAASTITADKMSVTSLSAINANLGTITAGSISGVSLTVGTSPAVSGTTMTGAGAVIGTTGNFALGNSTTNISYNGSQMTLNGNVVATGNLNLNAATIPVYSQLNSNYTTSSNISSYTLLSASMDTGGQPVTVFYNFLADNSTVSSTITFYLYISGVLVKTNYVIGNGVDSPTLALNGVAYLANPSSGSFNIEIKISNTGNGFYTAYAPSTNVSGCYFYALGTKR